jgi:hypothetical protein
MNPNSKDVKDVITRIEAELEEILRNIPIEHRGVLFNRICKDFHPQRNTQKLEFAYMMEWAGLNNKDKNRPVLISLLTTDEIHPRRDLFPETEREWLLAQFIAATVIQWLPTTIGMSFQVSAFEKAGGKLNYQLPSDEE